MFSLNPRTPETVARIKERPNKHADRNKALILAVVAEDHLDKKLNYPEIKLTISILFLSLSPFKYLYLEIYVF